MNSILKNILAIVAGCILGSFINMGLITAGQKIFPIEGIDPNDMEAFAAIIPTLTAEYFIFPFLAHALGTFVGAFVAGLISTNKMKYAMIVGALFFCGGVFMIFILSGPLWFNVLDLISYWIMAWLGGTVAIRFSNKNVNFSD